MKFIITALLMVQSLPVYATDIPFVDESYVIDQSSPQRATYTYKYDEYGRLENTDWFKLDWHELQADYRTDFDEYILTYGGDTFNEAKMNYYSQFNFTNKDRYHLTDIRPLKEWGFLNHPPQHEKLENLSKFSKRFGPIDYENLEHRFFDTDFHKEIDRVSKSELTFGNELKILENNGSYHKKLELIKNAKSEIFMSSLSFVCDSSVKKLVNELISAHNRGVKVYAMDDRMMSKLLGHNSCPRKLKKNGVNFLRANDFWKHEGRTVYHHKKLVIDGSIAIVGGQNQLNADNLSRDTDFKNKDVDLLIKGPMVTDIAIGFLKDWQYFKKKNTFIRIGRRGKRTTVGKDIADLSSTLEKYIQKKEHETSLHYRGQENYDTILSNKESRMNGVCRFIQQSPYENQRNIGEAYLVALSETRNYLGIMDPIRSDTLYPSVFKDAPLIEKLDSFKMFNKIHNKVKELQENNLAIDFLTTGTDMTGNEIIDIKNQKIKDLLADTTISDKRLRKKVKKLLKGIKKWNDYFGEAHFNNLISDYAVYDNTDVWLHLSFLHSKIFYFDRLMASIGSYNFQHNATDHSYENTILCLDKELNKALDEVFVRDMINSVPLKFNKIQ